MGNRRKLAEHRNQMEVEHRHRLATGQHGRDPRGKQSIELGTSRWWRESAPTCAGACPQRGRCLSLSASSKFL